jgi:DedD protein
VTELIKQRLLGMLIVVIAGVVFLPDLLDGKKQMTKEEFRRIPMKPELVDQPMITEFPKEQVMAVMEDAPGLAEDSALDVEQTDPESNMTTDEASTGDVTNVQTEQQPSMETKPITEVAVESSPQDNPQSKQVQANFEKPVWVLRLGSFRHKANVDALIDKLNAEGIRTFVKPVEAKAGLLHRVFIGPESERQLLETQMPKIKEITKLEGKITQFDPIN